MGFETRTSQDKVNALYYVHCGATRIATFCGTFTVVVVVYPLFGSATGSKKERITNLILLNAISKPRIGENGSMNGGTDGSMVRDSVLS